MPKRTLLALAIGFNMVTAHAAWTTLGAASPTSWEGSEYLYSQYVNEQKIMVLTCTAATEEAQSAVIKLSYQGHTRMEVVCDGTEQSKRMWGASDNPLLPTPYVIATVASSPNLLTPSTLTLTGKLIGENTGKELTTYAPYTFIGTAGNSCYVDVEQMIDFSLDPGGSKSAPVTRTNAANTRALSINITPSSSSGGYGTLLNEGSTSASPVYVIEGATMESGAFITNNADNTLAVYVPKNTSPGIYSGTANVVVSCQ